MRPDGFRPIILLVITCQLLRRASHDALLSRGFPVHVTDDGTAALNFLRETAVPPDLVIIDLKVGDVRASLLSAAAKRHARVLPIASDRFRPGPDNLELGFDIETLVTHVESMFA